GFRHDVGSPPDHRRPACGKVDPLSLGGQRVLFQPTHRAPLPEASGWGKAGQGRLSGLYPEAPGHHERHDARPKAVAAHPKCLDQSWSKQIDSEMHLFAVPARRRVMSRTGPALIEALAVTIRDLQARARSMGDASGGSSLQLEHVTSELEATPALSA